MSSIDNYNEWPFFCAVKKFVPRSGGVNIDAVAYNSQNASKLNFDKVVVLLGQSEDTVRKQMTVSLNGGTPIIVRCCYNKTCPRVVNWVVCSAGVGTGYKTDQPIPQIVERFGLTR